MAATPEHAGGDLTEWDCGAWPRRRPPSCNPGTFGSDTPTMRLLLHLHSAGPSAAQDWLRRRRVAMAEGRDPDADDGAAKPQFIAEERERLANTDFDTFHFGLDEDIECERDDWR